MKLSIKILAVIGLLALLAIIPLQIDDSLDPEVADLVAQVANTQESRAYTYMMGFEAPADENPMIVGQEKIANYQRKQDNPDDWQAYENDGVIPRPDSDVFCSFRGPQCLTSLVELARDEAAATSVLQNHQQLTERFYQWLEMGDYRTPTQPALDEPLPDFSVSMVANRLVLLDLMQLTDTDRSAALAGLHQHITALRRMLAQQDTLIGKVVFTVKVSEAIDVLYLVASGGETVLDLPLSPLGQDERDFTLPLGRELVGAYYMYQELDRHPKFFQEDGYTPGWAVRLLFKPNLTINSAYPPYQQAIAYSQLSLPAFAEAMNTHQAASLPTSPLRNRAGDILNRVAIPNFAKYVGEVMDLGAKISLYNQLLETEFAAGQSMTNPYYPEQEKSLTEQGVYHCLDGPLEDKRHTRCLPLGLAL